MSGFYYYSTLSAATTRNIKARPDTPNAVNDKTCGCHGRGDKWWLCSYHEGFEDGVQAAGGH